MSNIWRPVELSLLNEQQSNEENISDELEMPIFLMTHLPAAGAASNQVKYLQTLRRVYKQMCIHYKHDNCKENQPNYAYSNLLNYYSFVYKIGKTEYLKITNKFSFLFSLSV